MTARKTSPRKPAAKPTTTSQPTPETGPAAAAQAVEEQAPELAWCRIGRDLEEFSPECPRHEFDPGTGLCNLHFVTRLDLREVARHD